MSPILSSTHFASSATSFITNPSPYISILLPIVKDLTLLASLFAVAVSFTYSFLASNNDGKLDASYLRWRKPLLAAFVTWVVLTIFNSALSLANLLAIPLPNAFDPNSLNSYLFQTGVGQSQLYSLLFIVLALVVTIAAIRVRTLMAVFILTMIATLAPTFESHSTALGSHGLVVGSLFYHVAFVMMWVGGVFGLILLPTSQRELALPRFSRFAFWAAMVVVISGAINAVTRFSRISDIFSLYGLVLFFKVALTLLVITYGYRHRKLLTVTLQNSSHKARELLIQELGFMAITFILGGWLTTIAPPAPASTSLPTPALDITGEAMPAAPNLTRLFFLYRPDGIFMGALLLAAFLYFTAVRSLTRRGDKWPVGRSISFIAFLAFSDYATSGGIGIYAHFAFSFHMMAHMIMGMVSPIFFVLAAPITLALRTLPQGRDGQERGLRQTLMGVLASRYVKIITHPIIALALLDGSLFVLYFTPLFGTLMHSHIGHILMTVHFFAAGALFFFVIIGIDPNPRKTPFIARIVLIFAAMSIHAFFSIALLGTSSLLDGGYFASLQRPWHTNLLADQHLGGSIGWALSEVPILLALIATFIQWVKDDSREQKRIEKASTLAHQHGEKDELDLYNEYLKKLNEANER